MSKRRAFKLPGVFGQCRQHRSLETATTDKGHHVYITLAQLCAMFSQEAGKRDGLEEVFHDNGQLESKVNWKDGYGTGLSEWFYENGQLEIRGNYIDGKRDGLQNTLYNSYSLQVEPAVLLEEKIL